jgi:hypothetical protein
MIHFYRFPLGVLLFFLVLLPSALLADQKPLDRRLILALEQVDPGQMLDVRRAGGSRSTGFFSAVREGQLVLQAAPSDTLPAPAPEMIDLREIRHLAVRQGAAATGFRTGFTPGALLGGSLGLLFGLALDSLDGQQDSTTGVLSLGLASGIVGGTILGAVGAGIGALSTEWHTIYRSEAEDWDAAALPSPPRTALALGVGGCSGINTDRDFTESGPFGSIRLNRRLGSDWEVGPEISYFNISGTYLETFDYGTGSYESRTAISSVLLFGLVGGWSGSEQGWGPFFNLGAGLYVGGNGFPGLSVGGGMRFSDEGGRQMSFELRDHINLNDEDAGNTVYHILTAGAVFSFSL